MPKKKILIFGGSGFLGNALYKELNSYYNTFATYHSNIVSFKKNQKFYAFNFESDPVSVLLETIQPDIVISAVRGNFTSQIHFHNELISWVYRNDTKIIFLSSANVFDRFTNYPSYEYDKTFSESVYGHFKIKIENALMRLPLRNHLIARIPMIYGHGSERIQELKTLHHLKSSIEIFPNVVTNATTVSRFTQQIHYLINRNKVGIYHLGSKDLTHHGDLIKDICKTLSLNEPMFKKVFDSNDDRYLAVLPKDNLLPKYLQYSIDDVILESMKL